ncbi:hypothetical protein ACNPM5_21740 [Enterobacter hormaechei]|uniref:hypothetical protein n=1 Tax=Enterobacter hormaechei TaxID=158836 RepID=UPI003AB04962
MNTITREQLIKDLKASTQNSSRMFEIGEETICALVSLLTAPPAPASVPDRSMFEKWWESEHGSPLDSWDSLRTTDGYCDDGIDGQFEAWNACRAAMLQGAEPVSQPCTLREGVAAIRNSGIAIDADKIQAERDALNSPVIPDGWVAVPVEPTIAILDEFDSIIDYGAEDSKDAWSRLLAAAWIKSLPAAPQQEVKSGR